MRGWGLGDLGGDGGDVACVDQTDAATGRRGTERANPDDRRGEREEVLHVGVVPQQGVIKTGVQQAGFDLGLSAAAGDWGVSRRLAGDLHDVVDAGVFGGGDDSEFQLRGSRG